EVAPGPVVPFVEAAPAPPVVPPAARPKLTPLAPQRVALQVTISQETHEKILYAQALLGQTSGELAQLLDRAVDELVAKLEQRKFAARARLRSCSRPGATNGRYVPAAERRAVWQRDKGQCSYVGPDGRRCEARTHLEYD